VKVLVRVEPKIGIEPTTCCLQVPGGRSVDVHAGPSPGLLFRARWPKSVESAPGCRTRCRTGSWRDLDSDLAQLDTGLPNSRRAVGARRSTGARVSGGFPLPGDLAESAEDVLEERVNVVRFDRIPPGCKVPTPESGTWRVSRADPRGRWRNGGSTQGAKHRFGRRDAPHSRPQTRRVSQ